MMGIREEIEGLRPPIKAPHAELAVMYCQVLDDALSILDKWELVLEGEIWESEDDCKDYVAGMVTRHFKPGDRIVIHRRK